MTDREFWIAFMVLLLILVYIALKSRNIETFRDKSLQETVINAVKQAYETYQPRARDAYMHVLAMIKDNKLSEKFLNLS